MQRAFFTISDTSGAKQHPHAAAGPNGIADSYSARGQAICTVMLSMDSPSKWLTLYEFSTPSAAGAEGAADIHGALGQAICTVILIRNFP